MSNAHQTNRDQNQAGLIFCPNWVALAGMSGELMRA